MTFVRLNQPHHACTSLRLLVLSWLHIHYIIVMLYVFSGGFVIGNSCILAEANMICHIRKDLHLLAE